VSPMMATTAAAPRCAANCSAGPSTISLPNPAELSSPLSRTSISTMAGGPLGGRTMSTVVARGETTALARPGTTAPNQDVYTQSISALH